MKRIELYRYAFDFGVDYESADVADMLDIHKYLMAKNNIKQYSGLLHKYLLHYWVLVDL